MEIVLCADSNYVLPARVTICSVCANNKQEHLGFHVVTDYESLSDVESLKEETDKWGASLNVYEVDRQKCVDLPYGRAGQPSHASMASYYRLFFASLLPPEIERVIYLDCDMIVRHSLEELWTMDMDGKAVAAVDDMYNVDATKYNTLRYHPSEGYFNAGLLLINLKCWRDNGIEEVFLDFAKNYPERIVFHDQDVMNYTLKDKKIRLPFKYNVQDGFLYHDIHFLVWPYEDEYSEAINNPAVIHYSIRFKPWHDDCLHPWLDEYRKYVRLANLDIKSFPRRKERLTLYQKLRPIIVKTGLLKPLIQFRTVNPL